MTPHQINLVQSSWQHVVPIQETAAALFYGRLFALDPTLKPLFKGDLKVQGRRLMTAIGGAISNLTCFDRFAPVLRNLGGRHVQYGVRDEHFETAGSALLWTLEQGLGAAFTNEVRDAWVAAYCIVVSTMKEGAELVKQAA